MFKNIKLSFWPVQIVGWIFYWVMIGITFLSVLPPDRSIGALFANKLVRAVIGFLLTCAMRYAYKRFVAASHFSLAAQVSIAFSIIFGTVWTYLMLAFYWAAGTNFDFPSAHARAPRDILDFSITLFAWSALYFGIKFWREWQTERDNALKSSALATQAQLEALRYQLNPHFLFNALNSIRASIDEDAARAKGMITSLSEFLRFSLLNQNDKKIPLRVELEAVRSYLDIEKIRFDEKLSVEFDIEPKAEEFKVPAFLLNPLVENAVKHGMRTSEEVLRLKIVARSDGGGLDLSVLNSGKLENGKSINGNGIGVKNVSERIEKLFGPNGKFEIRQDGEFVRASIEIKE